MARVRSTPQMLFSDCSAVLCKQMVYLAEHNFERVQYALKFPSSKHGNTSTREAYFTGLVQSDHIVSLKEVRNTPACTAMLLSHPCSHLGA
eukprot:8334246-Pyramimonas_sp.AAC.1